MGRRQDEFDSLLNQIPAEDRSLAEEGLGAGMSEKEVRWMCEQSRLLQELRCEEPVVLDGGFTARVMARIDAQKPKSIWDLFVSPVLARQLAFASMVLMAMLAGFVVARSSEEAAVAQHTKRTLMVQEHPDNLGADRTRDRQNMLVTLASYVGEE